MSLTILLAFVGTCIVLGLTPGPNMALIVANTLSGGLRSGLATLAGTTTGLAILMVVAAVGMTSMMVFMAQWFDAIRWAGAVYLAVLGAMQLRSFWRRRQAGDTAAAVPIAAHGGSLYAQGVLVSLSNPKVLLFLGAFLPQFVEPSGDVVLQLGVLSVLFVVILAAVDIAYTVPLARARSSFKPRQLAILDGASGVFLLAGGLALATLRRP